ncbi:MAG: leucine--tRNA ligase [bacterium]|nr:leucine--tRNA ligase [bacterium]
MRYNPSEIEKKWQQYWQEHVMYQAAEDSSKEKLYVLDMFPYPSGDGLHVGHVEGYTATDIYSRLKRMQGFNVLHPMGWDAFGLPAENYAIKTGVHPKETTEQAIKTFRRQIQDLGLSYDWSREIGTHTPEYYKWTQWLFLLLYNNKLAYKAKANVNWCDSCKTVLANEQVVDGRCERCKNEVVQRELEQWFFKITEFAEDLIKDIQEVDWPSSTVLNQLHWIGKSEGALLKFQIKDSDSVVEVFTTRPDTLFGATYMVLAPEHPLAQQLQSKISNWNEIQLYIEATQKKTELERTELTKKKTGVRLEGVMAINPANKEEIPVFIADYVLANYGTGAIMAVPAHDARDWEFAEKYNLKSAMVICPLEPGSHTCPVLEEAYTEPGYLVGSGKFDGTPSEKAKWEITKSVKGEKKTNYHLRDWLISRQRYWGAPIPIVYDPAGKPHPIPEEHLPWLLPTDVEFRPTGTSPLSESKELLERTERIFGKGWKPEVDTMDTFVCSSWYFLRFADSNNTKEFASKKQIKKWLPVDLYVGGAEHTVMHLLYARFFTKVLHKLGYVDFKEPFLKLRHQGIIIAEDGKKMSKSLGNVVNPDSEIVRQGADTVRMYEMFLGPLEDMKPWNTKNIAGIRRFLDKAWMFVESWKEGKGTEALERNIHQTIRKVGEDIEEFKFNTAISALMICLSEMRTAQEAGNHATRSQMESFLKMLAPFAPHLAEELWSVIGNKASIHEQSWPLFDSKAAQAESVRLVIQVNGRVRDTIEVPPAISEEEAKRLALDNEKVQGLLGGKAPKRVVVVPGRLVNIVTE